MYGFSQTSTSLIWLVTPPAVLVGFPIHCTWLARRVQPKLQSGTFGDLENFLEEGVIASVLMPVSLFMFGEWLFLLIAVELGGKLTRRFGNTISMDDSIVCSLDGPDRGHLSLHGGHVLSHQLGVFVHSRDLSEICRQHFRGQ